MINWEHNEWQGDARWDDKYAALIEAVREVANQLDKLNSTYSETLQYESGESPIIYNPNAR